MASLYPLEETNPQNPPSGEFDKGGMHFSDDAITISSIQDLDALGPERMEFFVRQYFEEGIAGLRFDSLVAEGKFLGQARQIFGLPKITIHQGEDDSSHRLSVSGALGKVMGHTVLADSSGEYVKALDVILSGTENAPDIVILDFGLGARTGSDVALPILERQKQLAAKKKLVKTTHVIINSAYPIADILKSFGASREDLVIDPTVKGEAYTIRGYDNLQIVPKNGPSALFSAVNGIVDFTTRQDLQRITSKSELLEA